MSIAGLLLYGMAGPKTASEGVIVTIDDGSMLIDRFELVPRGPYSFQASLRFLEGFSPAAYAQASNRQHLHMAFVADGTEDVAGVCLQSRGANVVGDTFGSADPAIVRRQVERILSLDVDGTGFPDVGKRDPVIGQLQARYEGLRPVCFYSPYEAAVWAIISNRIRITQAARIKDRIAQDHGPSVRIHGETHHAFPGPTILSSLETAPGLFGRKAEYLHGIAQAEMEGRLEAVRLRSQPSNVAITQLKELPGIGDFGAQHILLRGAGDPDYLPTSEPRVPRAVQMAYRLDQLPSPEQLEALSEAWRPYRLWAVFLLRVMLEAETNEISGRSRSRSSQK